MIRLVSILALTWSLSQAAFGSTYQLDPDHSMAIFKVGHMGISNIYGRFNDVSGSFTLDDSSGDLKSANIEIKTQSVDTNVPRRDDHLRSPDFFNAQQYPSLTFTSTSVAANGAGKFKLTGTLKIHGVSKVVTVDVAKVGSGQDGDGNNRVGAEGTLAIKRSEFGMTGLTNLAGDDVQILLAFEGAAQ